MLEPTIDQIAIRDHPSLSLLAIAPAGCGKTEALALRVAALATLGTIRPPRRILVTTFTNKAKDNITERLSAYLPSSLLRERVTVANFHGLSARIFRAHANVIDMDPAAIIPDSDWVAEQCRHRNYPYPTAQKIQKILQTIKQDDISDSEVEARLLHSGETQALEIEHLRISEGRLTYHDLPRVASLILAHDAVADLYRNHFAAIIVDEFQDLTPQQLRIINRIGTGKTTYTGDLAQGIYSFAGADPAQIYAAITAECVDRIEFSESHRSSPAVLHAVNALTELTGGIHLSAARPQSWPGGGLVAKLDYTDAAAEARGVVNLCRYILERGSKLRIGVIARISNRRRFVDAAFTDSELPFSRWDDGVLDTDTAKIIKSMLATLDATEFENSDSPLAQLRERAGLDTIQDPDTRKSLVDAIDWCHDLLQAGELPHDIRKRIRASGSSLIDITGVHLLSGHAGKGQQFDWVIALGLEDDHIPYYEAKTPELVSEEARILSVILSRARHGAFLTVAADVPNKQGGSWPKKPSRFWENLTGTYLDRTQALQWLENADWGQLQTR